MGGKTKKRQTLKLIDFPSRNFDERAHGSVIDKLVLHYTGMQNSEVSLARMCMVLRKLVAIT